jgi:hypothetical protein
MADRLFDTGIFDSGIFKTEEPIPGIFDSGNFDTGIFDHRATRAPGVNYGFGGSVVPDVQRVGDTRWQGVREARQAARDAFKAVAKAKAPKRKQAVAKAAEAVAQVAKAVSQPVTQLPQLDDAVVADLDALQALLAGLMNAERIMAQQARDAAAEWARIEADIRVENEQVEELMLVLALAI